MAQSVDLTNPIAANGPPGQAARERRRWVAVGGSQLAFTGAMPWLVSAAAARVDRSLTVLAVGAGPMGRLDLHNDPDCRNFLTCAGLAVTHVTVHARGGVLDRSAA